MSFKVIDGSGPDKEERQREEERNRTRSRFSWAIRDCAANMLRIIRGAGKPYELLAQMQEAINAAVEFRDVHGHLPSDVIADVLKIEDRMAQDRLRLEDGSLDRAAYDRSWENGYFDRLNAEEQIYRGALRAIAAQLLGQNLQQIAGEREFDDGVSALERAKEKQRKVFQEEMRAARAPASRSAKPIDLGPGPASEKKQQRTVDERIPTQEPKFGRRQRGFDQNDLRDLRKAIKDKDQKRIDELTAKIGQPKP
ncbi:hypothetical protein [Bradyrhizobium oligotrophicum]|uniref:hypothetical protein n=1 Tax=Bradyrhizobium oligotrophicum TaxID=44255 RepID=UPI003EB9AF35